VFFEKVDVFDQGIEAGHGQALTLKSQRGFISAELGWYQTVFCFHIAATSAFILEGLRFGGGWPSLLLFGFGVGCWFILSPERKWMK
jgi:hypothetical protein